MEEIFFKWYQKFGDLTTSRHNLVLSLVWIFIILSFIIFPHFIKIKVPIDFLYWFFSTIAQSLVALVAFVGIFAIFQMQIIKNEKNRIIDSIINDVLKLAVKPMNIFTETEIISQMEKIISAKKRILDHSEIEKYQKIKIAYSKLEDELQLSNSFIRYPLLKFVVFTLLVVLISFIFLSFVDLIYIFYMGISSMFLIVFLSAYSLFLTIKFIAGILLYDLGEEV